ncbi:MAG: phage major capsid protein [Chloroflexi bacterium]|nr:phage major capsid protein [Chloroflexota bacterium]
MKLHLKPMYDKVVAANAERNRIAAQIVALNDESKYDEALALQPNLDTANKEYDGANKMYLSLLATTDGEDPAQRFNAPMGQQQPDPKNAKDLRATPEYMTEWLDAFRHGITPGNIAQSGRSERYQRLTNALTETGGSPAGEDGGFLNPVDIDNRIIELSRQYVDLAGIVNVETVTTLTGWRVIEQFAAALPLTKITTEMEEQTVEGEQPKFNKVDFSLDEYRDFLPVSNTLMQDTPANLIDYLSKWFSKKLILTNNSLVLALINAITGTAVADYKTTLSAIKTVLNKTLDPVFSVTANLVINQSGLDLLDQLDDGTGRPLLQPDPSLATAFRVKGRPVVTLSDAHWANMTGPSRTRIAIGDGRSYMSIFRRAGFEFASTNIGGKAWRTNSTEVRGIARMDSAEMDSGAMTVLKVTL